MSVIKQPASGPAAWGILNRASSAAALLAAALLMPEGCTQSVSQPPAAHPAPGSIVATAPPRLSPTAALAAATMPSTAPATAPAVVATTLPITPMPATMPATMPAATMPVTAVPGAAMAATTMPSPAPSNAAPPSAAAFNPAPAPSDPAEQQADAALASRFAALAQSALPAKVPDNALWEPIFSEIGAMLSASVKLDPHSARYARLAADAAARTGDQTALLANLYAAHAAAPADDFTTVRIVDLYLDKMQTSSEKLAYLKKQLGSPALSAPVRAHAGVLAAQILLERDQPDAARNVLAEALRLNPSSGEGLRFHYDTLPAGASPFEQVTALLQILRANPGQSQYTTRLADLLASAGLSHEAIPWYQLTITLTAAAGQPDLRAAQDCSAELLLADQEPDAASLAQQLVTIDPGNLDNWFLKLAVIHGNTSNTDYQSTLQQARNVAGNALAVAAAGPAGPGSSAPTTRPITTAGDYPLPDLLAAVQQIQNTKPADAQQRASAGFVAAAGNYATLELLYEHDGTAAAPAVAALAKLLPATDPTLQRLQGWAALQAGDHAAADQFLSAAAETDPLAALGYVKLQSEATTPASSELASSQPSTAPASSPGASPQSSRAAAARLLGAYPGHMIGAILFDQLRDTSARPTLSSQAQALAAAVDRFPMDWLNVLNQPQSFYLMQVEPIDVARSYGQPLLATLTIQNVGDQDLTIGPGGVLQRGVVFNADIHGIADKHFANVAYDELAGPLVLPARQSTSQTIRLDQGALEQYVDDNPEVAMQVYGTVTSNPAPGPGGSIRPAAGGYSIAFGKVFGRVAAAPGSAEAIQSEQNLTQGTPRQKIDALQLMGRQIQRAQADNAGGDAAAKQLPMQLQAIRRAEADHSPAVSAWASYTGLLVFPPAQRPALLQQMTGSTNWRARALAMLALPMLPPAEQTSLATPLADDPEPSVRALASARLAYAAVASRLPATQPAN